MRRVKVAVTQMACSWDLDNNIKKAEVMVREASEKGANIILLQELFETPYFCQQEKYEYLKLATTLEDNRAINHFKKIAKELKVVLPISFFERAGNVTFNTLAMIDVSGEILGIYRKTHIPDGHSYEEKFYFSPGDTGFKVWNTAYGKIGVGVCWDQWFPEAARGMALLGAEILMYPTAIGSEPILGEDSQTHWQRVMQGHAAANIMPLIASNRIGTEIDETSMTFYGSSFIAGPTGEIIAQADRKNQTVLVAEFDLDKIREKRQGWGVFRDRRPEMYGSIMSMDSSK
ncbi:N-carbamoylputrescine amidase [Clostridium vincentii]|uniref:N-carbamoyl-D-amino acid hydrolase n=1 Tax=Clostridium vincentii TaxID=52704 RepID=A0A2T0BAY7_9CLOT|nr:N-carbamoylputrescine amidase [Clostridium vincentii]PRR81005.1 N-carbamoyl-D-amino acid hydrolase [Clostridium vincentii]